MTIFGHFWRFLKNRPFSERTWERGCFQNIIMLLIITHPKFWVSVVFISLGTYNRPYRNWKIFLCKILEGKQRVFYAALANHFIISFWSNLYLLDITTTKNGEGHGCCVDSTVAASSVNAGLELKSIPSTFDNCSQNCEWFTDDVVIKGQSTT